jgi:excinuclease ABC subunit C
MNESLKAKLNTLPRSSGVYFHKDKSGDIIYVGKAAVLKNRVKQYFQNTRDMDIKTKALVAEINDVDWAETESEIDALFLEAEMVKRYMPRFNILLRDDKSSTFVRIDMKSNWPHVSFTRNPADDGAEYFGPYYNGFAVKKALRYLRKVFPYFTKVVSLNNLNTLDLDAHLGLSPVEMTSSEYKTNLRKLISYIKGDRKKIISELENDMKLAAKNHDFETAAVIRNRLNNLRELQRRIMFGDKEFMDISKDKALRDLTDLLGLSKIPVRIEGFDISHISGVDVVASMVVFTNGVSDRREYRKFKTRIDQNNDFYNMNETIERRLSEKNLKSWGKPNLVLIDGGKGQLDSALKARDSRGQFDIPFIGLAKGDEQIVVRRNALALAGPAKSFAPNSDSITKSELGAAPRLVTRGYSDIVVNDIKLNELNGFKEVTVDYILLNLPKSSHIIKLLQRIRDESHRFAVSYHTTLRNVRLTSNSLQEIPGIGPKTRAKLINKFGSLRGVKNASEADIISLIGQSKAHLVMKYIKVL